MLASRETPCSRRPCVPPPTPPPADEVDAGGSAPAALTRLDFGDTDECCPWAEHRGVDRRLPPPTAPPSAGPTSSAPQQPGSPSSSSAPVNAADGSSDGGAEEACSATSSSEARRPSSPSTGPSTPTTVALGGSDNARVPCLRIQSPDAVGEEWQSAPPSATAKDGPADGCTETGQGGEGLDTNDDDADDYVSCCTGPPSPLCSLSPVSCDKEAEGRPEGLSEDLVFDDFASYFDEDNFDACHDAFNTFATGGASITACEGTDHTVIFESLSVAEVDLQKLAKIVLDSALSLYDLPSERLPCPAATYDVGFPKGTNQSASHRAIPSDRLGGDKCVELLNRFTSAPPLVNSKGEALSKFEWKSSVICKLYLAAVNPSSHVEDRRLWPASPSGSRSVHQVEALRTPDASDRSRTGSVRSAGVGREREAATLSYQNAGAAGFPPPSPMRSAVSQSGANAAAAALSAASRPKHLDLEHAERLCSISKAAFMKRSAEELGFLRDHYAEVLKLAVAHLRHWLDSKEQAVMDSEMNHKVIETLVLQAQKAVGENLTVGRDAKRRKPKSVSSVLKPPKVKQGERAIGWRMPM